MKPLTIRIRANTKESLESEADEYDVSVSEYVRELIDKGREYDEIADRLDEKEERIRDLEQELADRPDTADELDELREEVARLESVADDRDRLAEEVEELEAEVDSLEARNRDLTNQLAESNRRIDGAAELVEYVEEERSLAQRREEREKQKDEAGVLKRAKWWLVGMPSEQRE